MKDAASQDLFVEITPSRILFGNQTRLPDSRPMFDVLFPLDGVKRSRIYFEMDELLAIVPFGETLDKTVFMLVDAADQVSRDADI
jgi:hypothetical protein